MRKIWRRLSAVILGAATLAALVTVSAGAVGSAVVAVELRPNVEIVVDGVSRTFYNAQGKEVHPLYYQGTHYLPVRAIGELMGKNVNWDGASLTVTLSGTRTDGPTRGTPDTAAKVQSVSAELHPDFTIVVDGTQRTFTDAQGNAVYPILYQGSNYLPVRAIGELMGKSVSWNGASRVITLSGAPLVTDADTFGPGGTSAPADGKVIGEAAAKAKALAQAGLKESQVTFLGAELEWDDGRQIYDVEFYTRDNKEYDYEIDALTGEIRSVDYDADHWAPQTSGGYIGEAKAKSVALSAAGYSAGEVSGLRCELERDDGRWEYQVEFRKGSMEYEFEIDAVTGKILSQDQESFYD